MHANQIHQKFLKKFPIFVFFLLVGLGSILLGSDIKQAPYNDNYIPTPRGSTIISVRLPIERDNIREYEVDSSASIRGGTIEGIYSDSGQHFSRIGKVSHVDMVQLTTFISDMCRGAYRVAYDHDREPVYAVGVQCPGVIVTERIPVGQAPALLEHLREVLVRAVP